jgi:sigma-E factor negative regulatory protein RseB
MRNTPSILTCALLGLSLLTGAEVRAQTDATVGERAALPSVSAAGQPALSLSNWLMRLHEASRRRAYMGTFVVSSGGQLSTARIWHVCDGRQQMERVESLSGTPRTTFRHNDQVITFTPDNKLAVVERRESLGLFPGLLQSGPATLEQYYALRQSGVDRVAGFEADVVQIEPRDGWRFAHRIWSEKKTGLALKLQTLDADGQVLEQAAFSELQLDAPVRMDKLAQMMAHTEGYRVETRQRQATTAQAEGWALRTPVPGFEPMSCQRQELPDAPYGVQWVFSDGLASVSLFIETYDRRRHTQAGTMRMGATQVLAQRLHERRGDWWITAVGEVPPKTLQAFVQGLERTK